MKNAGHSVNIDLTCNNRKDSFTNHSYTMKGFIKLILPIDPPVMIEVIVLTVVYFKSLQTTKLWQSFLNSLFVSRC